MYSTVRKNYCVCSQTQVWCGWIWGCLQMRERLSQTRWQNEKNLRLSYPLQMLSASVCSDIMYPEGVCNSYQQLFLTIQQRSSDKQQLQLSPSAHVVIQNDDSQFQLMCSFANSHTKKWAIQTHWHCCQHTCQVIAPERREAETASSPPILLHVKQRRNTFSLTWQHLQQCRKDPRIFTCYTGMLRLLDMHYLVAVMAVILYGRSEGRNTKPDLRANFSP